MPSLSTEELGPCTNMQLVSSRPEVSGTSHVTLIYWDLDIVLVGRCSPFEISIHQQQHSQRSIVQMEDHRSGARITRIRQPGESSRNCGVRDSPKELVTCQYQDVHCRTQPRPRRDLQCSLKSACLGLRTVHVYKDIPDYSYSIQYSTAVTNRRRLPG